jgi:hypothetical protein
MSKVKTFLFGPIKNYEMPAFAWWDSKRHEYNIKLVSCLLSAQFIFLLMAISQNKVTSENFVQKISSMLFAGAITVGFFNLIYFLFPALEALLFKKINLLYRRYSFAFLNVINAGFVLTALVALVIVKR